MNKGYVIYHEEDGVYLGSFIGLGFWSQLDPAGQDCAVVFPSPETAQQVMDGWDTRPALGSYRFVEVEADMDDGCYASVAACMRAGLPEWLVEGSRTANELPL